MLSLLSPELEYIFPLLVVISYLTHSLSEADGYLSVVWNAIASALAVFIETEASFPEDTVHVLPGPTGREMVLGIGRDLPSD